MTNNLLSFYRNRRSVYALSKESPASDAEIESFLKEAITHAPSAFNSQSSRTVLLLGKKHDEFWDAALEALRPLVKDPEAWKGTEGKISSFRAGHGTVLFFEDQTVVAGLQAQFSLYKDNFPIWSLQSSGMLQHMVWTGLADLGLGASLQHYSPLVDEWVYANTGAPKTWKLLAQMPFGKQTAPVAEKTFNPIDGRFKVIK